MKNGVHKRIPLTELEQVGTHEGHELLETLSKRRVHGLHESDESIPCDVMLWSLGSRGDGRGTRLGGPAWGRAPQDVPVVNGRRAHFVFQVDFVDSLDLFMGLHLPGDLLQVYVLPDDEGLIWSDSFTGVWRSIDDLHSPLTRSEQYPEQACLVRSWDTSRVHGSQGVTWEGLESRIIEQSKIGGILFDLQYFFAEEDVCGDEERCLFVMAGRTLPGPEQILPWVGVRGPCGIDGIHHIQRSRLMMRMRDMNIACLVDSHGCLRFVESST